MEESKAYFEEQTTNYLDVIKRRFWVIAAFFIVCSSTVTLGTFLSVSLYKASTNIIVEGENANVLDAGDTATGSVNYNIFENYIETQIAIIKSDKIAGKVFEEFKLGDTPRYRKKIILGKSFQRKFLSDLNVLRVRDTRMIEISVFNPDPKTSADLANRIAELYSQDNRMRRALTFIRNQRMASLNSDFLRLQSKLDGMSNFLGPKHPEMIALKDEIKAMAERIQNERAAASSDKPVTEEQALLQDTLLKVQEDSVFASSRMNNIAIVDRAVVPTEIAKPRRLLNIALGIVLGLMGGFLLAFFVDYMDDSIKSEDDAKKYLGKWVYLGYLLSERSAGRGSQKRSKLDRLVVESKHSPSAEAYRLLRTRILWSIGNHNLAKNMVILSCIPEEGKTAVASNLAISISQLNLKVLLVDTDLRKGRIAESYDLPNDSGLAHYLGENKSLESVIKKTAIPGLSVVTCGKSDIDSSQLFNSPQMKKFVAEAAQKYDHVIYDTAPLTVISDTALLLSTVPGGAVLVVRSGVTGLRLLKKGLSIVQESGANLIGIVLNGLSSPESRAYSYYHRIYQNRQ